MEPVKRILVAVDGSQASVHAAMRALDISKPLQASVTLVHVTPPTILPGDVPIAPIAELRESELARGAGILRDVSLAIEQPNIATLNLLGPPAELVADTAMDEGYDLVVVGYKGRNAVSRMLLGSTADRLVHICKKPVLVVR
jgi:nucleotide-binding universal stress UspA family protein